MKDHGEPPFHSINVKVPTTRNDIKPIAVILTVQSRTNDTYCHNVFITAAPGPTPTTRTEAAGSLLLHESARRAGYPGRGSHVVRSAAVTSLQPQRGTGSTLKYRSYPGNT